MTREPSLKDVIDDLTALLVREKSALLAARFDEAGKLVTEKQRLSSVLESMLIDSRHAANAAGFRKRLGAMVALAQENEALLNAAQSGVKFARSRLQEIIHRQRNVGVYGESGEKLLAPDAGVTRRKLA